jgi:hypothetical protein
MGPGRLPEGLVGHVNISDPRAYRCMGDGQVFSREHRALGCAVPETAAGRLVPSLVTLP